MRSRRLVREDGFNMDSFVLHSIDGFKASMERGQLGLVRAEAAKFSKAQMYDIGYLEGKKTGVTATTNGVAATNGAPMTNGAAKTNGVEKPNVAGIIEGLNTLLAPLKDGAASLDDADRHAVMEALHSAAFEYESTFDVVSLLRHQSRCR